MKNLIILMLFMTCINIRGQDSKPDNEIEIKFNVFLDGKQIETDSVQVGIINTTSKMPHYAIINNQFTTYLKPDKQYYIVITHPRYNKQILRLKTSINEFKSGGRVYVYLKKGNDTCNMGIMKYNEQLKCYILNENY